MLAIGTRIRFKHTITEDACGDHPEFILAKKDTYGTVTGYKSESLKAVQLKAGWPAQNYDVTWDGFTKSGFYAAEGEDFEVCPTCNGKGVIAYQRRPTEVESNWDGDGPLEAIDCEKPCPSCRMEGLK